MPPIPCPPQSMDASDPVVDSSCLFDKSLSTLDDDTTTNKSNTNTTTPPATVLSSIGDDTPTFDFRSKLEWISFLSGVVLLVLVGPPVGIVVFTSMIWEGVDRGFRGGFVDSGQELSGVIFTAFIPWLERMTNKFNSQFVKKSEDAYMMNCIFGYGVLIPLLFFGCAWHAQQNDGAVHFGLAYVYHVLRIGPYFMNFAYVYTLCHKEGHSFSGLYAKSYNDYTCLRMVFNWWIGMFYGVLPATFAYGHSINHHKYNNAEEDVITTSDKPRDNFFNWVAYLPRYFLYAFNVSTISAFVREKNWNIVSKVFFGSVWFLGWCYIWIVLVGPVFTLTYVAFPFFEAGVLLAAVNWSWHVFIDPDDPENEFVQSVTILDGCINVLNEDAHVVHHQYPGVHWTEHPKFVEKHWDNYVDNRASVFRGTHAFEIFGMAVARDYDALAKKFVDIKGARDGCPMTHTERVDLIKSRLRSCWWGPRVEEWNNKNQQQKKKGLKQE